MSLLVLLMVLPINAGTKTFQSKDFLQAPNKGDSSYSIAENPPKIDVTLIEGLPKGGKGTLWSSWGDGCFAGNGKYYTSIGDHDGDNATSHLYEYDPETKQLTKVLDVAKFVELKAGEYGHGKIHSGIHEAKDGWLYFATYWGKHRQIFEAFERGYKGCILLRFNPKTKKTENLGVLVPRAGLPASCFDRERGLLYFFAVRRDKVSSPYQSDVTVYDVQKQKVIFVGGGDVTEGQRAFLLDRRGRVYFSVSDGRLSYYDPEQNKIIATEMKLPNGESLRAAAPATKDGMIYGMTQKGRTFVLDPQKQTIKDLGPNFEKGHYTAVMVLSPDEKYLYSIPGAHGSSYRIGTPVIQYERKTGKRKVLGFLNEVVRREMNYNLGGIYNLQIDPKGERLFTTFNGAPLVKDAKRVSGFGQPSVVVIHVPKSER